MIDSCSPSKLDPGFSATYSNPRLLMTSSMKSEPGRSTVRAVPGGCSVSAASCAPDCVTRAGRSGGSCGAPATGAPLATSAAALTAAPLRKRRRPTGSSLPFAMMPPPNLRESLLPTLTCRAELSTHLVRLGLRILRFAAYGIPAHHEHFMAYHVRSRIDVHRERLPMRARLTTTACAATLTFLLVIAGQTVSTGA